MDLAGFVISCFLYVLPAYIANSSAALFGGGAPIDLGRKFGDGRRVFGDGKTFRGLFIGIFFGAVAGNVIGFSVAGTGFSIGSVEFYTRLGFLLAAGALLGDLAASFVKRRLGYERGQLMPLVDQLDFIAGALILGSLVYIPSVWTVMFLIIVTPILHLLLNGIGFLLKLKKVPW